MVGFSLRSLLARIFTTILVAAIAMSQPRNSLAEDSKICACELSERPPTKEKAETARWMMKSLDWGVLSSLSTRLQDDDGGPVPFGNVYSFVDGPCHNSTGVPYFYGSYMDQSFKDSLVNPTVSFTLSEASLSSVCAERSGLSSCLLLSKYGDPENPTCARLTVTGKLVPVDETSEEFKFAQESFCQRHISMSYWPEDHGWVVGRLEIQDLWLIDFFGGATILTPEEYFSVGVKPLTVLAEEDEDSEGDSV